MADEKATCPICGKSFTKRGLAGHMQWKHGKKPYQTQAESKAKPGGSKFKRLNEAEAKLKAIREELSSGSVKSEEAKHIVGAVQQGLEAKGYKLVRVEQPESIASQASKQPESIASQASEQPESIASQRLDQMSPDEIVDLIADAVEATWDLSWSDPVGLAAERARKMRGLQA